MKYQIVTPYPTGLLKNISNSLAAIETYKVPTSVEIVNSSNGLILHSPNGTRWLLQADDLGNLTLTSL